MRLRGPEGGRREGRKTRPTLNANVHDLFFFAKFFF
jgi:hypothetical protein